MTQVRNRTVNPLDLLDTDLQALNVQVMEREVVLLGPRVAVALSAAAAAETAKRLAVAAAVAAQAESNGSQASQAFSPDA